MSAWSTDVKGYVGTIIKRASGYKIYSPQHQQAEYYFIDAVDSRCEDIEDDITTINESKGIENGIAELDGNGKLPSGQLTTHDHEQNYITLTDASTVTWDLSVGKRAKVTLGGNRTLAISNPVQCEGVLIVIQDGTGSRTLTLPAGSKVINGGGGAVTLSTAANSIDILSFTYDGTNYFWTIGKNYT